MRFLDTPAAQKVIDRMNAWIYAHSDDLVTPDQTLSASRRPSIQLLMDNYSTIEREVMAALPAATPIQGDMFFGPDITSDRKWYKIYLKWYSKPNERALKLFPETLDLIERCPDVHLAMVSILRPGARIKPHYGPWAGSIRVHICIRAPDSADCHMKVAGHVFQWKTGEMLAFDDTYYHSVVNLTDMNRIILFLDVERKMKSAWAQAIVRFLNRTVARLTTRD